jgi:hypothetical protein
VDWTSFTEGDLVVGGQCEYTRREYGGGENFNSLPPNPPNLVVPG